MTSFHVVPFPYFVFSQAAKLYIKTVRRVGPVNVSHEEIRRVIQDAGIVSPKQRRWHHCVYERGQVYVVSHLNISVI